MLTVDLRGNLHIHLRKEVSAHNQEEKNPAPRYLLVKAKALRRDGLVMAPAVETTAFDTGAREHHWRILQPLSWLFAIGIGTWGRKSDEPLGNDDEEDMRTERAFSLFEAKTFDYNMSEANVLAGGELGDKSPKDAAALQNAFERYFRSNDLDAFLRHVNQTGKAPTLISATDQLRPMNEALTKVNNEMERRNRGVRKISSSSSYDQSEELDNDEYHTSSQLTSLYEHLLKILPTDKCSHQAMLKLSDFHKTYNASMTPRFEMLVSRCRGVEPAGWQETCCTFDKNLASFQDSSADLDEVADLKICQNVQSHYQHNYVLNFSFSRQHFILQHAAKQESVYHDTTPVSLHNLVARRAFLHHPNRKGNSFTFRDKYFLALNLARCFFHLYNGPWASCSWDTKNIFFLSTPLGSTSDIHSCHKPYIRCCMQNTGNLLAHLDAGAHELPFFSPVMLHFARILIEIETGEAVVDSDTELPEGKKLRDLLSARMKSEFEGQISELYREAIYGCLDFGFDRMYALGGSQKAKDQKATDQHIIRTNIISKLEAHYKNWASKEPDNLYLRLNLEQFDRPPEASAKTPLPVNTVTPPTSLEAKPAIQSNQIPSGVSFFELFDEIETEYGKGEKQSSSAFFEKMDLLQKQYIIPVSDGVKTFRENERIKIAVLDSGVDTSGTDPLISGAFRGKKRIKAGWSPQGTEKKDYHDTYGHGTHVVRLLLKIAPKADIYVAKITDGKKLDESKSQDIVDAIKWAVEEDVHIITMSFGLGKTVDAVSTAIEDAFNQNKIIFAAAANNGGLSPRSYPATLLGVICVHATDGNGGPAGFNPSPAARIDNFATIGVAIDSEWNGEKVTKSGTSFATPVAAGIAANVLHFARTHLTGERDQLWLTRLHSYEGMRKMLDWMSHNGPGGYQNLCPWVIFPPQDGGVQQSHINNVCKNIRTAMALDQRPRDWKLNAWSDQL